MNDILIIGGGIGGLTLALALQHRNIPCRVFESAPQLKAISDRYKGIAGYDKSGLQR